jgi:hypothetical protein
MLAVGCAVFMPGQTQALTFSVTSDSRTSSGFADVLEEIKLRAGGPGDFMVSTGDIDPVSVTRNKLETAFGAGFVWYPVVGNHELPGDGTERYPGENMDSLRSYDYGTVNPGPAGCVETTYSFDTGPVHMSVINEIVNAEDNTMRFDIYRRRRW